MEITYELTKNDFTEAYSAHRNRNKFTKWFRRFFIGIAGLFFAVVFGGFLVKPSAEAAKSLMPLFGLMVMWIGALWFLPR